MVTVSEGVFEVRLQLEAWQDMPEEGGAAALRAYRLRAVGLHDKSAPYARIVEGLRFSLTEPRQAHQRWLLVRKALLALFP